MQLPDSDRLPVRHLAGAFRRTTNSYKFYWLLAILRHLGDGGDREVPVSDLVARMIAAVWYPVNYFRLSFGKQDRLERLVERIRAVADAPDDATRRAIRRAAGDVMQSDADVSKNVRSLDRYVPFRFLTPWFADKLRGMRDYKKNDRIEELADASFSGSAPALYRFVGGGDDEDIELHPRWTAYLHRHQRIARDFCLWNLLGYLRDKNPNVPNIAEKLLRPQARKLGGTPRKFWNLALDAHSDLRCPYSGAPLEKGAYDIDHFVPWSFVTHDLLWNLAPTAEAANRSKSDALPDLDAYFDHFAALQRAGFEAAFAEYKERWLEDYALLFGDELSVIHAMDESDFHDRLHERITPLMQIAANTGFPTNWTYQNP